MPSEAPAPAPRSRSTIVVDFVRNLLVGDTIPTVKVIIATLVLFVVMDRLLPSGQSWDGNQKLIALGIIAGLRVATMLANALKRG